jgi:hypothetical protein
MDPKELARQLEEGEITDELPKNLTFQGSGTTDKSFRNGQWDNLKMLGEG